MTPRTLSLIGLSVAPRQAGAEEPGQRVCHPGERFQRWQTWISAIPAWNEGWSAKVKR
jgi:hypothetical protein